MKIKLPELEYSYNSLEPYIDEETMRIHHTGHHQKYIDNFNAATENTELEGKAPEDIFIHISKVPDAVAKNAGQVFNHSMFWKCLSPASKMEPDGELAESIENHFGSFNKFRSSFSAAAAKQFGSGWVWLIRNNDKLIITSTPNHINPLMDIAGPMNVVSTGKPLLCLDVWEHAYYLKYKNKRTDYIEAFWNVVNWNEVNRQFHE